VFGHLYQSILDYDNEKASTNTFSLMKKTKLNVLTIVARGIFIIIGFLLLATLWSMSTLIIQESAAGAIIRVFVFFAILNAGWDVVKRIHISNSKVLNNIIQQIKNLPLGWYRLSLLLWFIIPIVLFLMLVDGDELVAVLMFFAGIILYWPLHFLIRWVIDGFRKQSSS